MELGHTKQTQNHQCTTPIANDCTVDRGKLPEPDQPFEEEEGERGSRGRGQLQFGGGGGAPP